MNIGIKLLPGYTVWCGCVCIPRHIHCSCSYKYIVMAHTHIGPDAPPTQHLAEIKKKKKKIMKDLILLQILQITIYFG